MTDRSFEESFAQVRDKLIALAKEQGVLASPIEVGDTVVVPISELKVGFGGAGGDAEGEGSGGKGNSGRGNAVGSVGLGNVKVTPMGFLVIDGDTVTLDGVTDEGGAK